MRKIIVSLISLITLQASAQQADIQLPKGFAITNITNDKGRVRHIAVHNNGDLYLKLENLRY
ncbi:MAG: hypothetical protein RIR90_1005, partial [Bacteroidota bacterium]